MEIKFENKECDDEVLTLDDVCAGELVALGDEIYLVTDSACRNNAVRLVEVETGCVIERSRKATVDKVLTGKLVVQDDECDYRYNSCSW